MKNVKKFLAMLVCVISIIPLCVMYASAENVGPTTCWTGSPGKSVTLTIETKGGFSRYVKFKQSTGTANMWSGETRDVYGYYTVTYKDSSGNQKSAIFNGETKKISLKSNETYTITITPYSNEQLSSVINPEIPGTRGDIDMFMSWKSSPSWWVSETKNVKSCK